MLQVTPPSRKCFFFFHYYTVMIDLTCSLVYNPVST